MAATVVVNEWNGTSGAQVATDKTGGTIRYKKADNATVDSVSPLQKPTTGQFDRSHKKYHRLRIGATGPSGSITNVRCYTTGAPGTGGVIYGRSAAAYSTPAAADGTGEGSTYLDVATWTSGAPKSLGAGPYSGTNTDIGDFVESYMRVADNIAAPGTTGLTTFTYQWDET